MQRIKERRIFNSTSLDCTKKFRDFHLSGLALAKLSDLICLEHQLSVIIRKPYRERQKRTEYPQKKSQRDEICEYKDGRQPALRGKGHSRFARFRSLEQGYTVDDLCAMMAGTAEHTSKFAGKVRTNARKKQLHDKPELSFLIDVRAKMQEGKGTGYARWAKIFNLKQMTKTLMFMEEHGIKSYEELTEKANGILEQREQLLSSIKSDEARLQEIQIMKKHLLNYRKSQDVFQAYKASGYNRKFYEEHRDVLTLRSAAKKAFDAYKQQHGQDSKLPRISELNAEYAATLERKKKNYAEYAKSKAEMQEWLTAQKIVQTVLGEEEKEKQQQYEQTVQNYL